MVIFLGLAAAVLYGSGDCLGGMATRKLPVLPVLLLADTAGLIVALVVALASPGSVSVAGLAWGISAGLIGGLGLIIFYIGLATGPMSVVAPVAGLVSTVLPVGVALAEGERPGVGVYAGAVLCLVAIVMTSSAGDGGGTAGPVGRASRPGRGRAIAYGAVAGAAFGLFFLLIRNAGESGEFWPVAAGRIGELAVVLVAAAVLRRSLSPGGADGRLPGLVRSTSSPTSATWRRPGPARSGWPWCWPRSTRGSRCCWPGWCLASGCAGCSGPASRSPRSGSCWSPCERGPGSGAGAHRAGALRLVPTSDQFGAEFHVPRGF
jgi:drug/metabolite transporter (DMT)-like permease